MTVSLMFTYIYMYRVDCQFDVHIFISKKLLLQRTGVDMFKICEQNRLAEQRKEEKKKEKNNEEKKEIIEKAT